MSGRSIALAVAVVVLVAAGDGLGQLPITRPVPQTSKNAGLAEGLNAARAMMRAKNYVDAERLLIALRDNYGLLPEIAFELKALYREKKDYRALKALVLEQMKAVADSFELLCQLGEAQFLDDSLEVAKRTWQKAFPQAGNQEHRYRLLAGYYHTYGFYDEAADVYRRGRVILKNPALFCDELADIYISQRNFAGAISEYIAKLRADPKAAEDISLQILRLSTESDDITGIRQELVQATRKNPEIPELHLLLGNLDMTRNDYEAALASYQVADRLAGGQGNFIFSFVQACLDNGQYAMAVKACDYYLNTYRGQPQRDRIALAKARALAELGSTQPALEILAQVEGRDDLSLAIEAAYNAALIYADKLNLVPEAKQRLAKVIGMKGNPTYANLARMKLAELHVKLAEFDQARGLLGQIGLTAMPSGISEKAAFLKAEIAFFAHDFEKAAELYHQLIGTFPKGYFVNDCLDRLAVLEAKPAGAELAALADALWHDFAGQTDSALALLGRLVAAKESPVGEYVAFQIARLADRLQRWPQAAAAYQSYLDVYPDGLYADRALYGLAIVYVERLQDPRQADKLLQRLLTDFPLSPLVEKARHQLNKIKQAKTS